MMYRPSTDAVVLFATRTMVPSLKTKCDNYRALPAYSPGASFRLRASLAA